MPYSLYLFYFTGVVLFYMVVNCNKSIDNLLPKTVVAGDTLNNRIETLKCLGANYRMIYSFALTIVAKFTIMFLLAEYLNLSRNFPIIRQIYQKP